MRLSKMTTILSHSLTRCLNGWLSTHSSNTLMDILVITKFVWPSKTTFTCPYGTFTYRWMSLVFAMHLLYFRGVRWRLSLTKLRAFMDDFSISGNCQETHLALIGTSVTLWSEKRLFSDIECHVALVCFTHHTSSRLKISFRDHERCKWLRCRSSAWSM